jgi:predicted Mrr-cat superfamily restriction endonuclease
MYYALFSRIFLFLFWIKRDSMIPTNITREHVLKTLQEINATTIPARRESTNYDLIFEGKRYPPKYVISLANKYANGNQLDSKAFDAIEAKTFLPTLGFEIKLKFDIKPGDIIGNQQISTLFGCGTQGGMRKSNSTQTLVLISDQTKPFYKDRWNGNILNYTGMGLAGDQSVTYMQNRTLAESRTNGIEVHLFEVDNPGQYTYRGIVQLASEPFEQQQEDQNGKIRKVVIFPIKLTSEMNANPNYWQIAPGEGAKDWDACRTDGIIPIYFNEYFQKNLTTDVLNFDKDQLMNYFKTNKPDATGASHALIWNFLHNVKIGDYILTNKGRGKALGWGIIKSEPKLYKGDRTFTVVRDVEWRETNLNRDLTPEQGKNFFTTINQISEDLFNSIILPEGLGLPAYKKQSILYGPPGTGKTYNSIIRAHEILFGYNDSKITYRTLQEKLREQQKQEIDLSQLSWLNAIMLAFDEIKKDKVQVSDIIQSKIIQEYRNYKKNRFINSTIWNILLTDSKLDSETVKLKKKSGNEYFDKDIDSNWFLIDKGKEYLRNLLEDLKEPSTTNDSQFSFVTFHQSFSYEDFVEGIRPNIDDSEGSQISYRIKDGIFKEICKKAALDPQNNYVLIIDEINRGNISKIFGELITLLEDNKRMGEIEEITVKLPYSGQEFSVPNNVYIIGTMNSTDKSIALVDVALRRRFHFERLNVDYTVIPNDDATKFLIELNSIICAIKNPDYEIGHYYFMNIPVSDSGNQELKKVFSDRILPLLEEYFFNDWEALATILGRDSINIEKRKKFVWNEDSGKFESDNGDYDQIYGRCIKHPDVVFENI